MNDRITSLFTDLGIGEKEAAIYIANLEAGPATGYELAKRAGVKQPTVYVLIESLRTKGLITTREERGKLVCVPVPPRQIVALWKGRVESLEASTPDLNALYERSTKKPRVLIYEGTKGVDAVYQTMLTPMGTGRDEMLVFGSVPAILRDYEHLLVPWRKTVRDKRNRIRDLVGNDECSRKYASEMLALCNPKYEVRLTAGEFGTTDTLIFRNRVAQIAHGETLFATVTDSPEIAATHRFLFEQAWAGAKMCVAAK